jgi:hypothetical protein
MIINGAVSFLSGFSRRNEFEKLARDPYALLTILLFKDRTSGQPLEEPAVSLFEPRCPVPKYLRRHLIKIGSMFPAFKVRILLINGPFITWREQEFPGKCSKILVLSDLCIVNETLAAHPLGECPLLFLCEIAPEFVPA